jgi:hypothetical protein
MVTMKSAKKTMNAIKTAAVNRVDHITTNEKIAGAAALGVAVGVAATAIGSSLMHGDKAATTSAKSAGKTVAPKG